MRLVAALAFALLFANAALAQDGGGDAGAMTASVVEGAATVQHAGAPAAEPLGEGASFREGDLVQTGPDSRVEIAMATGSVLRLGPDARLELRSAPASGKAFSAKLWLGSVWAKVHKLLQDETFHVETENAVAGVRGTEFLVEAGAQGGEDRVRVYEGAVEVRDHGGQWLHRVEVGREVAFRRGLRPAGIRTFDAASDRSHPLMRWVRERPAREMRREMREHRERREPLRDEGGKKDEGGKNRQEGGKNHQKEKHRRVFERLFRR